MSTTTQRPTPETDDIFDAYARCACGTACVRAKMQQIERERDEAREQIEAMREAIKNIYYLTEGCADGAPDASAHDKLCNEIADKLQPFLKP